MVKRRVPSVLTPRQIRRDDMRMELRIQGPAHPVPVRRRDQTTGVLKPRAALPTPHENRLLLEKPERRPHRLLVAVDQGRRDLRGCDREQHAHRLRRRERQVERRDVGLAVDRPQPLSLGPRIAALEQRIELARLDAALEAELTGASASPFARRLAAPRVVVVAALRDLLLVIALLTQGELADREHRGPSVAASPLGDTV